MPDEGETTADEISITEEQARSPGISDWARVKRIGHEQSMTVQARTEE